MKKRLFVAVMTILLSLAVIISGGLLGALLEYVGVWVYGWEATGQGYACGLFIGAFALCFLGWAMIGD